MMPLLPVHLLYNTKVLHFYKYETDWSLFWLKSSTTSCGCQDEGHLQLFLLTSTQSDLCSSLLTLLVIALPITTSWCRGEVSILSIGPSICLYLFLNHQSVHRKFLLWRKASQNLKTNSLLSVICSPPRCIFMVIWSVSVSITWLETPWKWRGLSLWPTAVFLAPILVFKWNK